MSARRSGGEADLARTDTMSGLKSKRVADRLRAVQALARAAGEPAAGDRTPTIRTTGATHTVPSDEERLALLTRALEDSSNLVIQAAADGLRRYAWARSGTKPPVEAMMNAYRRLAADGPRRDPGCLARRALVAAFAALNAFEAGDLCLHAVKTVQIERSGNGLEDMAVPLRAQAAAALAALRPAGSLVALTLLLFDTEPKVELPPQERPYATLQARKAAARALADLGDPGGAAVLALRIVRPDGELDEILHECMDALTRLDERAALDVLMPLLSERRPALVVGAATALARLGPAYHEPVAEALARTCVNGPWECGVPVALALASLRSDQGERALHLLADHPDHGVRLAAVAGWVERGGPSADAVLRRLAELDPVDDVRRAASDALRAK